MISVQKEMFSVWEGSVERAVIFACFPGSSGLARVTGVSLASLLSACTHGRLLSSLPALSPSVYLSHLTAWARTSLSVWKENSESQQTPCVLLKRSWPRSQKEGGQVSP